MKLLPMLLLQLALTAGALVIYDHMRGAPAPAETIPDPGDDNELAERVAALEASRAPALRTDGADTPWRARIEALERAVAASVPQAVEPTSDDDAQGQPPSEATPMASVAEEPTAAEIKRFRRIAAAVRREERMEKNRKRVDGTIDKLGLNLSRVQRAKVHAAHAAFEPRIHEIWSEVKRRASETVAAGGEVVRKEIVGHTQARIRSEFAATLAPFLPQDDADALARGLMAGGK